MEQFFSIYNFNGMRPKNKYLEITINNYSIRGEEERERIARKLHDTDAQNLRY